MQEIKQHFVKGFNMKKIFFAILSALIVSCGTLAASAETLYRGTDWTSVPEAWTVTARNGGTVSASDGSLLLEYDTTSNAALARSGIMTKQNEVSENNLIIQISFTAEGLSDESIRTLSLRDDSAAGEVQLLQIAGNNMSFFNGQCSYEKELTENESVEVIIAADVSDAAEGKVKGIVYVNGEEVGEAAEYTWPQVFNLKKTALNLVSRLKSKTAAKGNWKISKMCLLQSGGISITTNPENGGAVGKEYVEAGFDDFQSPSMLSEEYYTLLADGEEQGFTVSENDGLYRITPDSPFEQGTKYIFRINSVKNIFGEITDDSAEIEFNALPAGYVLTEAEISTDKTEIVSGETAVLTVTSTDKEPKEVILYINGEAIQTTDSVPFEYTFDKEEKGEYEIYAAVKDSYGVSVKTDKITISVLENDAPVITAEGISDGRIIKSGIDINLSVTASDSNGIGGGTVYLDGKAIGAYAEGTSQYTLTSLTLGAHSLRITVYDIYGKISTKTISFTVSNSYSRLVLTESDFTSWRSTVTLNSGIAFYAQRGYFDFKEVDSEHGLSAILGIDIANENYTVANRAYANINVGGITGSMDFESEFYVYEVPENKSGNNFALSLKKDSSTSVNIMTVTDKITAGKNSIALETKRWYKFRLYIDVRNSVFSVYIDGEPLVENYPMDEEFDCLDYIRIWSPAYDGVKTWWAFDNISASMYYDTPVITGFGEDGGNTVSASEKEFSVQLEGIALNPKSVSAKTVTVKSGETEIELEAVGYDAGTNKLFIKTADYLKAGKSYEIKIDGSVKMSTGEVLGMDLCGTFTAGGGALAVSDDAFTESGGALKFSAKLGNDSEDALTVCAVAVVWDGNTYKSTKAASLTVNPYETKTLTINGIPAQTGETAKIYLINSFTEKKLLSEKVYEYTSNN